MIGRGEGPISKVYLGSQRVAKVMFRGEDILSELVVEADWTFLARMPQARDSMSMVDYGTSIYIVGGVRDGVGSDSLDCYNSLSDTYSNLGSMPLERYYTTIGEIGGSLYSAGGMMSDGSVTDQLYIYDIANDQWTDDNATLTTARTEAAGVVNQGKFYVLGGCDADGGKLTSIEMYNPATQTWSNFSNLNYARSKICAATYGIFIFVVGGVGTSGLLKFTECLNVGTGATSTMHSFPVAASGVALVDRQNIVYSTGGENAAGLINQSYAYLISSGGWSSLAVMNKARALVNMCNINNELYALGGRASLSGYGYNEKYVF